MSRPNDDERKLSRGSFIVRTGVPLAASALPAQASAATAAPPGAGERSAGPNPVPVSLVVNGKRENVHVEPRVTLLDLLRERLQLTGTKKGCDQGTCGACTVLVNGRRIVSCLTLAIMHRDDRITTIEGLGTPERLHPMQAAFLEHDGFQCGYCTPGQIVSAVGFLNEKRPADAATVREFMSGNICRCGAYTNIVAAIQDVAKGGDASV
jgi:xanthine dehydrogenase YagT iron-sulfur-binding subunit